MPATALTAVGTPGAVSDVAGEILLDAFDAGPVPSAFVAFTVKVYAVPLVSPVTVNGVDGPVAVLLPGEEVTV